MDIRSAFMTMNILDTFRYNKCKQHPFKWKTYNNQWIQTELIPIFLHNKELFFDPDFKIDLKNTAFENLEDQLPTLGKWIINSFGFIEQANEMSVTDPELYSKVQALNVIRTLWKLLNDNKQTQTYNNIIFGSIHT